MPTVQRFRFFSATPDVPAFAVNPPPNMSDNPPPLPLCKRISRGKQDAQYCDDGFQNDDENGHRIPSNWKTMMRMMRIVR